MSSIQETRLELAGVMAQIKKGTMSRKTAIEINNAARTIVNSIRIQLEYGNQRGESPKIEFMGKNN